MKTTITNAIESGYVVQKVAAENPYREGTNRHARFGAYKNGRSVLAVLNDERVKRDGFRHDLATGVVKMVRKG